MGNFDEYFDNVFRKYFNSDLEKIEFTNGLVKTDNVYCSRDLIFYKSGREVDSNFRTEMVKIYATRQGLRNLALAILSVLFNDDMNSLEILLDNKQSTFRTVSIEYDHHHLIELSRRCKKYSFHPSKISKHPWLHSNFNSWDLPSFEITNQERMCLSEEDWENRDVCVITGTDEALIILADLLLNMNVGINEDIVELQLEGKWGFEGVAPSGADAEFEVPGALGYDCFVEETGEDYE